MNRPMSLVMPHWLVWFGAAFVLVSANAEEKVVQEKSKPLQMERVTSYRTTQIDGLSIFYREAGPKDGRRFCCCTVYLLRRECLSRSFRGFPTVII
jgi:hypothetical protein